MRKQIWYHLFTILVMAGIFGCATTTYPPPVLEDNKYTNFEYQYSVDLPPGWEVHTKAPREIAFVLGGEDTEESKAMKLVQVNKTSKSMICIQSERINIKYDSILEASGDGLWKLGRDMEKELKRHFDISRFDYDINQGSLFDTQFKIESGQKAIQPQVFMMADFDIQLTLGVCMVKCKQFIYPCQGRKSCSAEFIVWSRRENFLDSLSAYDDVVSSFTIYVAKENGQ